MIIKRALLAGHSGSAVADVQGKSKNKSARSTGKASGPAPPYSNDPVLEWPGGLVSLRAAEDGRYATHACHSHFVFAVCKWGCARVVVRKVLYEHCWLFAVRSSLVSTVIFDQFDLSVSFCYIFLLRQHAISAVNSSTIVYSGLEGVCSLKTSSL